MHRKTSLAGLGLAILIATSPGNAAAVDPLSGPEVKNHVIGHQAINPMRHHLQRDGGGGISLPTPHKNDAINGHEGGGVSQPHVSNYQHANTGQDRDNERIKRSIDRLEKTGNFRKETLDKMRRAAQREQGDKDVMQKRAKALELQRSYDKAMADLNRQKKQLRDEYKQQMQALKPDRPKDKRSEAENSRNGHRFGVQPKMYIK